MDVSEKNHQSLEQAHEELKREYAALKEEYDRIKAKERDLKVINEFAVSILSNNTVDEIVWAVAKHAIAYLDLEDCVIYLLDDSGTQLIQRAAHGPKNPEAYEILDPIVIPLGSGIVGSVAVSGIAEIIEDTRLDERYIVDDDIRLSELAVPILYQGDVIGVIDSEHSQLNFFTESHKNILTTLASMASAKIINAITIEKLQESETELKTYRDHLEELVSIRTKNLTERTDELVKTLFNLKTTQDQLVEAKEAAERTNKAKSEFLSNMSHELRTPLNGILGYAQIITGDTNLQPYQQRGIDVIYKSGRHLLTLINEILDFGKIEARKMELYPSEIPLNDFLSHIITLMNIRAQEKNLALLFETDDLLNITVLADEKRLRQILINLLGNAIKFTDEGEVRLKVRPLFSSRMTSRLKNRLTCRFSVIDTGIGISPEHIDSIFLPFNQVQDLISLSGAGMVRQRAMGTGLGLAITHQLIVLMGSHIRVESELGKGSTFSFDLTLPIAEFNMQETKPSYQPPMSIIGYKGDVRQILVVDDLLQNRLVLQNMLAPLGFEIEEARDGQEAIDKAKKTKPDLILMDMHMPIMSGLEAVKQIRLFAPDLPIAAVSASVLQHQQVSTISAGCNAFLAKPVDLEELLVKIEHLLQLEWTYNPSPATNQAENEPLITPPIKELKHLHELALRGNIPRLRKKIIQLEQIQPECAPFATQIKELAKHFKRKELLVLLEKYLSSS